MLRKIFGRIILLFFLLPLISSGQIMDYGNAWYDAEKPWVKMQLAEDGIYRVTATDLQNAGYNVSGIIPGNIHLYYRGIEEYIYVENVGSLLDFFEFYGRKNDGRVDSLMYRKKSTQGGTVSEVLIQPNIRASIFSDTSAYFMTWDNTPSTQRYDPFFQTNYGAFAPSTSFKYEAYSDFNLTYPSNYYNVASGKLYTPEQDLNSDYVTAQGYWGGVLNGNLGVYLPTPYYVNTGDPAYFSTRMAAQSDGGHYLKISLGANVIASDTILGLYIKNYNTNITTPLTASTPVSFTSTYPGTDNNRVSFVSILYDRAFNMGGENMIKMRAWVNNSESYFRFSNTDIVSEGIALDLKDKKRIRGTASLDTLRMIVPGSTNKRDIQVATDNGIKKPLIVPHSLANLSSSQNAAEMVMITHRKIGNSAERYKSYRDTSQVNPLNVKIVYTDELYDEFGYGTVTPIAIKRFCKYALDNWATPPKFFFLWGKGQHITRDKPNNLVPTWGYPACDWEFVSNFDNDAVSPVPLAPIGRVNVINDELGNDYIDKVITYENTPWDAWMKDGVFLGGGLNEGEQDNIFNYLKTMRGMMEESPFLGEAYYFQNRNNSFDSNSDYPSATQHINSGVSVLQFFGHSAPTIVDVDIKPAIEYFNWGKFPIMLSFGCNGGDFTRDYTTFGEGWVGAKDRGAIGYIGNSTAGFMPQLGEYGKRFYPNLFEHFMGESIGEVLTETFSDYSDAFFAIPSSSNKNYQNHARQLNLQCDPSIRIYHPQKPDLEISEENIFFEPSSFSADLDSFYVNVVANNTGLAFADSFYLRINQTVPDGSIIEHEQKIFPSFKKRDTLVFKIHNTIGAQMAGLNTFDVFIDVLDSIAEYDDVENNRTIFEVVVPGKSPAIIYPYDFAVVGSSAIHLAASAHVMTQETHVRYVFQIDTIQEFTSEFMRSSGTIPGRAAYTKWDLPFQLEENQVYFWRVRLQDADEIVWSNASFKYMMGQNGWAQARPTQFFKDSGEGVQMDRETREWEFDDYGTELHAWVRSDGGRAKYQMGGYQCLNSTSGLYGVFYTPIDRLTLAPILQAVTSSDPSTGTSTLQLGDWYFASNYQMDAVTNSILNTKEGDYFLITSQQEAIPSLWPTDVFDALETIGCSDNVRNLHEQPSYTSFIIFGRKGANGASAIEILEPNSIWPDGLAMLDLIKVLTTKLSEGSVSSTVIGPSIQWKNLVWNWKAQEAAEVETATVSIYGTNLSGGDTLLLSGFERGSHDISMIDANQFPYIRLVAELSDPYKLTSPQLDNWHVIFDPVPDALLNPVTNFIFDNDTVEEGEDISMRLHIENITDYAFQDSMNIRYSVLYEDNTKHELIDQKILSPTPFAGFDHNFTFNTANLNLSGAHRMKIELNPAKNPMEKHYFNNLFYYDFHVLNDHINPILDVTFDGRHIMDGDIISPKPEITVMVSDENRYLPVNDTTLQLWFGIGDDKDELEFIPINGNPLVERIPPELPNSNQAKIIYRPDHLPDGYYKLVSQGYDNKGNHTGKLDYEISFEVVNESAITNVVNYPNPFSTCTKFVFTLTGEYVPEVFKIQIYTVTGRLVTNIDLSGMGDIHIGNNITEYCWDGTDDYGDILANGVYIYKVITKYNDEAYTHRDEDIDQFFKKGYGKLYIMR